MTLDDAIKHCQQVANKSDCECAKEHKQLAEWLQELKEFKKMQTNEEWFCQLPTGEKAEFFASIYPKRVGEALIKISNGDKEKWEEWLKQPHREE